MQGCGFDVVYFSYLLIEVSLQEIFRKKMCKNSTLKVVFFTFIYFYLCVYVCACVHMRVCI